MNFKININFSKVKTRIESNFQKLTNLPGFLVMNVNSPYRKPGSTPKPHPHLQIIKVNYFLSNLKFLSCVYYFLFHHSSEPIFYGRKKMEIC